MASSGSISTSYSNYTRFYLNWQIVEQDIANNRTLIKWQVGLYGQPGYSTFWYSNSIKINSIHLDGGGSLGSGTWSDITVSGGQSVQLKSGSKWVGHDSDGGLSLSAEVSGWLYGFGNKSTTGSWELPTIPRNSQVTTNDGGAYSLGTPLTIYTNRKSDSFSHTITIRLHNSSGAILQTINSVGKSTVWTPTTAQITAMQNAIPNTNRLTLYINQYNNQVKANSADSVYTYLRDANPTYSDFTFADSSAATVAITGNDQILVKGKSTLKVDIPAADKMVALKGATAARYVVAYDGASEQEDYSASATVTASFANPQATGNRTILVTAFDSRSNSTRVTKNVTVYDYAAPTIATKLTRENNFGSNTTVHIEGTYTPLVIGGANKNSLTTSTLQYRYKKSDTTTWGAWTTSAFTANTTDGTFTITDFVLSLDNQSKFDFEFKIADKFGTVTVTDSVDVGTPVMFVGKNGGEAAIGINKMPVQGALDVGGDIYSNGVKVLDEESTVLASNIDFEAVSVHKTSPQSHASTSTLAVSDLSADVTVPDGGRKLKITVWIGEITTTGGLTPVISLRDGSTTLAYWRQTIASAGFYASANIFYEDTFTAGTHTFSVWVGASSSTSFTIAAAAANPVLLLIERA